MDRGLAGSGENSRPPSRTATPTAAAPKSSSFSAINSAAHQQQPLQQMQHVSFPSVTQRPPQQPAQTLAATTSSHQPPAKSSSAAHPDNTDVTMAETSYGTRSRNRTNARPNYAEDQDMDFDFSSAATTTTTSKKRAAADASAPATNGAPDAKRAYQESTSTVAVNSNASAGAASGAKESAPSNAGAATGTSKKRKAAAAPSTSQHTSAVTATPPPAAARKQSVVPAASSSSSATARETNVMTFTKHKSTLNKKGELVADDGTKLSVNDHAYLVCEPPGDPYYLCRIMEFLHVESDNPNSPVDSLRVNWYYRPRDVARFSSDTRLVFGTMHSDMCPLTSLRGKCTITHRSEIDDLDAYRKERDSFYFVQVFDRFIRRSYECIPVQQIINVPEKVKKALDERWKFVVVETGRVKELTSAAKTCKRCARYCASSDSVDCAICKNSYHMNCVQPPLPRKPSRGFAWACGPCSRASERKQAARNTPTASGNGTEAEEDEPAEEEDALAASNDTTRAPSPSASDMVVDEHPATQAEIALAKMWPMRYLGIHARVEDALQYDDRAIYPRASSRLGPRHQANVNMWHGRPVELVKPAEIKKRYNKGPAGKKDSKLTKETLAAIEADREEKAKRPKWVQDEPPGYIARGEDYPDDDPRNTAKLLFKMPSAEEYPAAMAGSQQNNVVARQEKFIDDYMHKVKGTCRVVGVPPFGTNFLDKGLELLVRNNYDTDTALTKLKLIDRRRDLHEPVFSKGDLAKFEEGVAKYGSEHRLVRLHMKTNLPHADIVRFYYLWKKTPKGREIWGNYGGRKKRKIESDAGAKVQAEVAHDVDDSAFDNDKAARKNRGFQCKFCHTHHSRQWRRAPGVSPGQTAPPDGKGGSKDKKDRLVLALCLRCAGLWRKYAIQWEDMDELSKKVSAGGGRALKRKIDEELLRELMAANEAASAPAPEQANAASLTDGSEPPKKKSKIDRDGAQAAAAAAAAAKKEKPPPPPKEPTPPPPPIIPTQPTWKVLPCAICKGTDNTIACAHCKLTVHRRCFGVGESDGIRANGEVAWVCEQCQNDRNPAVSTDYSCCLCLTEETIVDLVDPPKVSHKKKTDRDREKERLEKELADGMRAEYRNKQLSLNRPVLPREPLKRTTGNNWVHVYCALWAPEIRFSDAKKLEVAEGFQLIPPARYEAACKLCKNKDHSNRVRDDAGACVICSQCNATFHASCAFEAGYTFGFNLQPIKGSRKDQVITATLGQETGALTAVIWCKEHTAKNAIHPIDEVIDDSGKTSLQVFAESYKQADLTLTGTVRKAAQAQLTKDKVQQASAQNNSRRESGAHGIAAAVKRGARTSSAAETKTEVEDGATDPASAPEAPVDRRCVKCDVEVTPKWHLLLELKQQEERPKTPELQRNSVTSGETADAPKATDADGVDAASSSQPPELPKQNIRFMAPGANGRAWDGMPKRNGSPSVQEPETNSGEPVIGIPVGTPSRDTNLPPPELNGDALTAPENQKKPEPEEVYHNHILPQFQNPGVQPTPVLVTEPEPEPSKDESPHEWLCHKCFIKKKLDPTPPPEERNQDGKDGVNGSSQPPVQLTIEQQFEIWDKPLPAPTTVPLPGALPPPDMNGYPPPPHYNPTMGHLHNGYPHPYGQQPNGYHPGPLPPAPMHESAFGRWGFQAQPSPNARPPFGPHPGRHSWAADPYAPPPPHSQPMANGIPSPHTTAPPTQSPTYPHLPPHPLQPMSAPRTYSDFELPGGPGGPLNSSANAPYGRPHEVTNGNPQPVHLSGQPSGPPPFAGSPELGPGRSESQPARPTTPRGQTNGTPGPSGASASPNLMHLLH